MPTKKTVVKQPSGAQRRLRLRVDSDYAALLRFNDQAEAEKRFTEKRAAEAAAREKVWEDTDRRFREERERVDEQARQSALHLAVRLDTAKAVAETAEKQKRRQQEANEERDRILGPEGRRKLLASRRGY